MSDIEKELRLLNPNKAYTFKIYLQNSKRKQGILFGYPAKNLNNTLSNKESPEELKLVDVTSIYKRGETNKSKNYRPVSVLPVVSKVFRKSCMII